MESMKILLLVALIQFTQSAYESSSECSMITAGTKKDYSDVISEGVLQSDFDTTRTVKDRLYYIPFEKNSLTFFISTPYAFDDQPVLKISDKDVELSSSVKQISSNDANKLMIEVQTEYDCPSEDYFGVPLINMSLSFEGCPSYFLTWQKSCGKDAIPPMYGLIIQEANSLLDRPYLYIDGEIKNNQMIIPPKMDQIYLKVSSHKQGYNFFPPYIKNFNEAMTKMYPVLKGNMAFGGNINPDVTKHLLLEFNCLGIQGTQDVTLVVNSALDQKIEFTFRKQCPNKSIFQVVKEDLKSSPFFDFMFLLFIIFMIFNCVCCIAGLTNIRPDRTDLVSRLPGSHVIRGVWMKMASQFTSAKKGLGNMDLNKLKFYKKEEEFQNAFGEEIQIDISSTYDQNKQKLKEQSLDNISLNQSQYGSI